MLHLLGAGLILFGSLGFSYLSLEKEKKKIKALENWEKILCLFQSEIAYKKQPLRFAIEEIEKKISGSEKEYLEKVKITLEQKPGLPFSKIWEEEGRSYAAQEKMSAEELNLIKELGIMTGFEDEALQIRFMEEQERKWQKLRGEKQKEHQERKKLVWTLGGSMGIVLILLLW